VEVSHRPAELFAAFDAPDLIAHAGLVQTIRLAERCGSPRLVAEKVYLTGAKNGAGTAGDAKIAGCRRGRGVLPSGPCDRPARASPAAAR
jgi:hypothetical protein